MSPSQQPEFEIGQSIAGTPYDVTATLGRGGMGTVYEVRHRELGRRFVLKVLHQHLGGRKDLISRMKNEWTALARLSDANIVQVTDAGYTDRGLPYYVMERLHGDTVAQLLRKEGALSVRRSIDIGLDVLSGLSAAHGTGVIHRDIKPQNLFVLADGRAKVLDFGIAQVSLPAERVVTAAGVAIGTPRFMAPEQAEGRKVDGRADIYSLALVLYEMLLGRGPFAHIKDPNQLVLAHTALVPVRLDSLSATIPAELADLVQRWLAKQPDERPFSAAAAREELAALAAELPDAVSAAQDLTGEVAYDAPTVGPGDEWTRLEGPLGKGASADEVGSGATTAFVEAAPTMGPTATHRAPAHSTGARLPSDDLVTAANSLLTRTTSRELVSARELFSLEQVETPHTDPSLLPSVSSPPMSSPPAGWSLAERRRRGPSSSALGVVLGVAAVVSLVAVGVFQASARLGLVPGSANVEPSTSEALTGRVEGPSVARPPAVQSETARLSGGSSIPAPSISSIPALPSPAEPAPTQPSSASTALPSAPDASGTRPSPPSAPQSSGAAQAARASDGPPRAPEAVAARPRPAPTDGSSVIKTTPVRSLPASGL